MLNQVVAMGGRLCAALGKLRRIGDRRSSGPTKSDLSVAWARLGDVDRQLSDALSPDERLLSKRAKAATEWIVLVQSWAKARSRELRDQACVQVHQHESALKDRLRAIRRGKAITLQLQDLAARADRYLASAVHAQSTVGLTDFAHSVVRNEVGSDIDDGSSDVLMDLVQGGFSDLTRSMTRVKCATDEGHVLRVSDACPHVSTPYRDGLEFWATAIRRCGDKVDACVQAREELEQLIADLQHIDIGLCREEKSTWTTIRASRKPFLDAAYKELPAEWLKAARVRAESRDMEPLDAPSKTPALVE